MKNKSIFFPILLLLYTIAHTQPANDLCANATLIPQSSTCVNISGTTVGVGATVEITHPRNITPCGSFFTESPEVWYRVVIGDDGNATVTVSANGGSPDLMLVALPTCASASDLACDLDGAVGLYPELVLSGRTPGETIYFSVEGESSSNGGAFNICAITGTLTLPVELTMFTAQANYANQITLNWRTDSESNNSHFIVEHSNNGIDFLEIGEVRGAGTTSITQLYNFLHEQPQAQNYYRLRQVDFDGQVKYTKIVGVALDGSDRPIGEFYPNPSETGMVNLNYHSIGDGELNISIFDLAGSLLLRQTKSVSEGVNTLSFDFSPLGSGIKTVKLEDIQHIYYRKLLIK